MSENISNNKHEPINKTSEKRGYSNVKSVMIIMLWILIWQIADFAINNKIILAGPVEVINTFFKSVTETDFVIVCVYSFTRITIGFLLSFLSGFLFALISYKCTLVEEILEPIISLLKTVPMISFVIMLLIWVGNQNLTIYLSFIVVLPLIYTSTLTGLKNADKNMLEMSESFNFSKWKKFVYIYRPAFMPFLISSSRVALGMCWKSGIMAEVIATPKPSVGREMYIAQQYLMTDKLFVWTVIVIIFSTLFEKIFIKLLEMLNKSGGALL